MNLLWLTWKDRKNPLAGGAEMVNEELAKRLVGDGHKVIFLVGGFKDGQKEETINGYKIVRLGNRWTVYWQAYRYYKKNLIDWPDLVIDEVNTIPFFAKWYSKKENLLFVPQLCRIIWFYQMFFPLNLIGYLLEPIYLWLLRGRKTITISESTRKDLIKHGFKASKVNIISMGIEIDPINNLESVKKYDKPTILYFGAIRAMKRPIHVLEAFKIAKKEIPDLQLKIAGGGKGRYYKKFINQINRSGHKQDIEYLGRIDDIKKQELMQKSHLICVSSIKEGWGLIVTEANSQGTPAIVYNIDGLRDSVKNNETGLICQKNIPKNLAGNIIELLNNKEKYQKLRISAWQWSKEINFEKSYEQFISKINE